MNRAIQFGFVFALFVLDSILQVLFPADFEWRRLFFVSSCGIVGLMLTLHKQPFRQAVALAMAVGLFIDIIQKGNFFLYTLSYGLTLVFVWIWSNQVNDSFIELVTLSILTIFVKELSLFVIMRISNLSHLSLFNWFVYREFLTLIVHIPLVTGIVFLHQFRNEILQGRDVRKRKAEDPLYMNIKRKA